MYKELPINQPVYSNINNISNASVTPDRVNTYRNSAGATVRRSGYYDYFYIGSYTSIDGMYQLGDSTIIVSDGNVYAKVINNDVLTLGTGLFVKGKRPIFAMYGNVLYAANGNDIVKITQLSASVLTDPAIPDGVSHVAVIDTYLLANEGGTGRVYHSKVGEPENFTEGGFFTAEQSSDSVVAIHTSWDEVLVFGTKTVERFYNDGVTPFVPINGGTLSIGCGAPYSITLIRDYFYWLSDSNELVRSTGNSYEIISEPVGDFFTNKFDNSNIIGDYIQLYSEKNKHHLYILTNPDYEQDGVTLVYDIIKNEWQGRWGYWDDKYTRFRGNSYAEANSMALLGDYANGKIYMFGETYEDAGDLLRSSWLTGWVDHGTMAFKESHQLRLRILRGEAQKYDSKNEATKGCELMVRWRDDGDRTWSNVHYINLGKIGEYKYYAHLNRLGRYRMRQYEFFMTDDAPLIIASAEELIEVTAL